jgi:hypothetical protein
LNWTTEQILKLAPDASAAKAAQSLLSFKKWSSLGTDERAAWGLCQGSGSKPYQAQIDLSEPAFKCSCPSRKFPCKHGLALFLLLVEERAAFKDPAQPEWVRKWILSRSQRTEKKEEKQAPAKAPRTAEAQAKAEKTAAKRGERVKEGADDLQRWLQDLVRTGLAAVAHKEAGFWENQAARLIDAQASGLARLVREMAAISVSGAGWQERVLHRVAQLHLLLEAFSRIDSLPEGMRDDVRTLIGWSEDQAAIKDQTGTRDEWLVLGQHIAMEDRLQVQRCWLRGFNSRRNALVLTFAYGNQAPFSGLIAGTRFAGELVFFPGNLGLRALVKSRNENTVPIDTLPARQVNDEIESWSATLASYPWLERYPLTLAGVTPSHQAGRWLLADAQGKSLTLDPRFSRLWQLVALSGGMPLDVFGEWNGESLLPLSVVAEGRSLELSA